MASTEDRHRDDRAELAYLERLNKDQLNELKVILRHVIDRRIEGIHYAESRRSAFATIGTAIFAASFALFAVVFYVSYRPLLIALTVMGIGTMVLGLVILVVYSLQTNFAYPFKPATKTWKWFYRDAIPNVGLFSVPWYARLGKKAANEQRVGYDSQLKQFKETQVGLIDPKVDVDQDVQQLFLLHVNERYKNLFLTQIRGIVYWGVIIVGVLFVAVLLALVILSRLGCQL